MRHIKLKCKTHGFPFGKVVEVGSEDGQIPSEVAKSLLEEGNAEEIIPESVAVVGSEDLKESVKLLSIDLVEVNARLTESMLAKTASDEKVDKLSEDLTSALNQNTALSDELQTLKEGSDDMKTIVLTKNTTINGEEFKKNDVVRVSTSIFDDLVNVQECAKEKIIKTAKAEKE